MTLNQRNTQRKTQIQKITFFSQCFFLTIPIFAVMFVCPCSAQTDGGVLPLAFLATLSQTLPRLFCISITSLNGAGCAKSEMENLQIWAKVRQAGCCDLSQTAAHLSFSCSNKLVKLCLYFHLQYFTVSATGSHVKLLLMTTQHFLTSTRFIIKATKNNKNPMGLLL